MRVRARVCVRLPLRRMCQNAYTFFSGSLFTPPYNLRLIQPQEKGNMTEGAGYEGAVWPGDLTQGRC